MRELLILRHAKSSWKNEGLTDHERPLNDRGRRDAPRMGALVRDGSFLPDRILCSDAVRARQTALLFREGAGSEIPLELMHSLYLASPERYYAALGELGPEVGRAMVIGHNPGLEELVTELTGAHEFVPTACLVRVGLKLDAWAEIGSHTAGKLLDLWRPKEL